MAVSKKEVQHWRKEMEILDRLYDERMKEWQRLIDLYDLRFKTQIRDLDSSELVRISRFYPLVRQIIASTAFNYPKLFFAIEEEEGSELATILERASASLLELMDAKPHVHQAIFDALTCSVGWLRIDYNPPGDDMIPPYVTNDAMSEDLTAVSRVAPGFVHLDPQCPPHKLGHARYIREKMWVPLRALRDDKTIKNRNQIKATSVNKDTDLGFGEVMGRDSESYEAKAVRESVENDDMVLVDRIHDRINRRLIMFADGVDEPIQDIEHPFIKMSFPEKMDLFGNILTDDYGQPIPDLGAGEPMPGWLVEDGFPFVPVKFDLHANSFYPQPHLKYVEDIQHGIVESMSRQAALLKRTARQGLVAKAEALENPNLVEDLRKGVDGQWHEVQDPTSNFRELQYGDVPPDQLRFEDRLRGYEEEITRVTDIESSGATPRTATEASILAASTSVNREWMQSKISEVYCRVVRNCFQIMGDFRYTPENFRVNVAPGGEGTMTRALTNADFLWTYRMSVQSGSMQPMFEQIQQDKFLNFYDRAASRPNFDQRELDRMLASSVDMVDIEKVMLTDMNPEATRAAQMENQRLISQRSDPGVVRGQDHKSHMKVHSELEADPMFQQLVQQAQARTFDGSPANMQAVQAAQQILQLRDQHMQMHQQAQAQEQQGIGPRSPGPQPDSLQSTVRGNAQNISNAMENEARTLEGTI